MANTPNKVKYGLENVVYAKKTISEAGEITYEHRLAFRVLSISLLMPTANRKISTQMTACISSSITTTAMTVIWKLQ